MADQADETVSPAPAGIAKRSPNPGGAANPARPRPLKPIKVLVYASESGRVEIMPYYRIAAKEEEENLGIDIRVEIDRILEAILPTFRARYR